MSQSLAQSCHTALSGLLYYHNGSSPSAVQIEMPCLYLFEPCITFRTLQSAAACGTSGGAQAVFVGTQPCGMFARKLKIL